ncbi:MAG: hypothetical protein K2Y18_10145 [Alphaproteobacteria bacterium]|jgi:hypothetical protein|nr:hypothetical protein [Alphaproteobacteria bacterium]
MNKYFMLAALSFGILASPITIAMDEEEPMSDLHQKKSAVTKRTERSSDLTNEDEMPAQDLPPKKDSWYVNNIAYQSGLHFENDEEMLQVLIQKQVAKNAKGEKARQRNQSKKQKSGDPSQIEDRSKQSEARAKRLQKRQHKIAVSQEQVNENNPMPQGQKRDRAEKTPLSLEGKRGLPIFDWGRDISSDPSDDGSNSADSNDSTNCAGTKFPKWDLENIDYEGIFGRTPVKINDFCTNDPFDYLMRLVDEQFNPNPITSMPPPMLVPDLSEKQAPQPKMPRVVVVQPVKTRAEDCIEKLQSQLREPTKMNPTDWRREKLYYESHFYHEFKDIHEFVIRWAQRLKECIEMAQRNDGNIAHLQQRIQLLKKRESFKPAKKMISQAATRFKQYDDMRTFSVDRVPVYETSAHRNKTVGFEIPETLSNDGALLCLNFLKESSKKAFDKTPENYRYHDALQAKSQFYAELYEMCQESIFEFNKIVKGRKFNG